MAGSSPRADRDPTRPERSTRRERPHRPTWDVPATDPPPARCPYCDRPFRGERARDLHVGGRHDATADERAAYEAAREAEEDDLFRLHLKVVFALGAVYAALVVLAVIGFSVG